MLGLRPAELATRRLHCVLWQRHACGARARFRGVARFHASERSCDARVPHTGRAHSVSHQRVRRHCAKDERLFVVWRLRQCETAVQSHVSRFDLGRVSMAGFVPQPDLAQCESPARTDPASHERRLAAIQRGRLQPDRSRVHGPDQRGRQFRGDPYRRHTPTPKSRKSRTRWGSMLHHRSKRRASICRSRTRRPRSAPRMPVRR